MSWEGGESHSLSKISDDVADQVALLLQLVVRDLGHQLIIVFGQVEIPILPFRQQVGDVLHQGTCD